MPMRGPRDVVRGADEVVIFALLVLVFVWGAVGILRAAWHLLHSPVTPVRKALAAAAIVIVVLAVVLTGGDFAILLRILTK